MNAQWCDCGALWCPFCGECHSLPPCTHYTDMCDSARETFVVGKAHSLGYMVIVENEFFSIRQADEKILALFPYTAQGLIAAEQWVRDVSLQGGLMELDRLANSSHLSLWTCLKLLWQAATDSLHSFKEGR